MQARPVPVPTITVPDHVHQQLKPRAEDNRRSLNQEVLQVLEQAVSHTTESDRRAARRACKTEQERTPSWSIDSSELKRAVREGLG